jgi:phosphatidylserine/phosphatidylglycerophosphate/cardiolipin synthase-like enzyme
MSHRLLIVLPDDTAKSILDPINAALHSLNIRLFLFTDPTLLGAVIAAQRSGVNVRVMLNPARRDGKSDNEKARKLLLKAGVKVRNSSEAFALTHQKSMVIDDTLEFVESLNWETRDLTETRDYAVVTTSKREVAEMIACFNADWSRKPFKPDPKSRLIWCPNDGRERIMARPAHKLKKNKLVEAVGGLRIMHDVGAKVDKLKNLKLHGKMLLADEKRAIVGSINLTPGSFDARRELAVETDAKHVVKRLVKTSRQDWKNSKKLDLSDEEKLAISADRRKGTSKQKALPR